MKTILIPTDFSENSWNAIAYAVKMFKDISCNFYVLHVGDLKQSSVEHNSFALPMEDLGSSIKEKLNELFKRIELLPISKNHHFIALEDYGNLVNILRKTVAEKKIDLIVMGTKGASGIKKSIIGSNTGDVITRIRCDVLVVPENAKYDSIKEITFPTDFTIFYTHRVLERITETMRLTEAMLGVLNVSRLSKNLNAIQENNQEFLFDYINETLPKKTSFHTLQNGNVNKAIQKFITKREANLIVMVAKNLNFLQRLFFDSTIEKLSFHTTVPLLVLHE